jgi:CarD family transcriptional regulator
MGTDCAVFHNGILSDKFNSYLWNVNEGAFMPQFKVGDHAVYPGHGVGRIDNIEFKEILGSKHEFYSVVIIESGMKVMIPAANIKSVGLRALINKEQGQQVVEILRDRNVKIDTQTWNRRYREYMEKIKTGSVVEIAAVLRDLYMLKVDKELSFGEKKMLETAKSLLMKELELAPEVKEIVNQDQAIKDIFNQQ